MLRGGTDARRANCTNHQCRRAGRACPRAAVRPLVVRHRRPSPPPRRRARGDRVRRLGFAARGRRGWLAEPCSGGSSRAVSALCELLRPHSRACRKRHRIVPGGAARGRERGDKPHARVHALRPDRGLEEARGRLDVRRRPWSVHARVLAVLQRLHVPATFFEVGFMLAVLPRHHQRDRRARIPDRRPHRAPSA